MIFIDKFKVVNSKIFQKFFYNTKNSILVASKELKKYRRGMIIETSTACQRGTMFIRKNDSANKVFSTGRYSCNTQQEAVNPRVANGTFSRLVVTP